MKKTNEQQNVTFFEVLRKTRQDTDNYKLALAVIETIVQQRPYDTNIKDLLTSIKEASFQLWKKMDEIEQEEAES